MTDIGYKGKSEVLAWIPGKSVPDRLTGLSYMKFLRKSDLNWAFFPVSEDARKFAEMSLRQEPSNRQEVVTMYLLLAAACEKLNDPAAAESAHAKARQLVDANQP